MGKIRIAVAGAGLIGQRHIEVALASPSCELSAIVDPAPGAEATASRAGVRLFRALDELFDTDRPDGVILATPNQLHVEHAVKCIDAGVPMLIEKPVAHTLEEGARLCHLADAAKAKILVGHHRAHSPIMARAKEIVDQGVLGKLVAVMGSAMFYKPDDYFDAAPWRRQTGGGPILLNMIHEVHNLRMLCGGIIAVQAFSSNATRGFPVEDTVAINLRFASGVLGTFLLSDTAGSPKSWEQTSQENKSYPTYPDEDCYVVAGTFGSLAVPTMRLRTYEKEEDRSWWKPFQVGVADLERADPLERQLEHFCAVIRDEAKPLVTARDGLENLRITEAIVEAARTGLTVNIEANTH